MSGLSVSAAIAAPNPAADDTFTVGSNPIGIAMNPAGTLAVVANSGDNTASIINIGSGTVASVPVGQAPQWVAIDPAGAYAFVTNSQGTSVTRINLADTTQTTTIRLSDAPSDIVIDGSGTYAYVNVGSGPSKKADRINLTTLNVDPGFLVGTTGPLVMSANDATIYSYHTNARKYRASDGLRTDFSTNAGGVIGAGLNADGSAIFGVNSDGWVRKTLIADDTTSDFTNGVGYNTSAWAPSGNFAYAVAANSHNFYRIDLDSGGVTELASNLSIPAGVAVAADRSFGLVTSLGDNKVYRFNSIAPPPPAPSPTLTPNSVVAGSSPAMTVGFTLVQDVNSTTWYAGVSWDGWTLSTDIDAFPTISGSRVTCPFTDGEVVVDSAVLANATPVRCWLWNDNGVPKFDLELDAAASLSSPEQVTLDIQGGLITAPVIPGSYTVAGYSWNNGYVDRGQTTVNVVAGSTPSNDASANAAVLLTGSTFVQSSTMGATIENPEWLIDPGTANSVWFSWTAAGDGPALFTTCDAPSGDTVLAIYDESDLTTPLVFDDDTCGSQGRASRVELNATAGTRYLIQVSAYSPADVSDFTLSYPEPMAVAAPEEIVTTVRQSVVVPLTGSCSDVADALLAWGTGATGGWQRGWEPWVSAVGGWACSRNLVKRGDRPWVVDNSGL